MNFRKWHQNEKLIVTAIWFLVVMCGVAYAGVNYSGFIDPGHDTIASVSPVMEQWFKAFGSQGAANGAKDTADQVVSAQLHTDNRNIGNQAIGLAGGERNMNSHIASYVLMPSQQGGTALNDLIKARDAATQLYAVTDDLANYMTVTIMRHYIEMTPDEARADIVAEATELGYIAPDPKMSKNEMPSFVSNAYAQSSTNIDATPALTPGRGRPSELNLSGKYGVSCQPPQTDQQKHGCGVLIGAKAETVECLFPMNQDTPTILSVLEKAHRLASEHSCGRTLHQEMKTLAETSIMGGGGSADNSGPFNFLISPAYARVDNGTGPSLAGKVRTAQTNACSTAKQVHEGNNTCPNNQQQATALETSLFGPAAKCNSVDKNAYNANSTLRNRTNMYEDVEGGCNLAPKQWLTSYGG